MNKIPIGRLGKIVAGQELGRIIEVVDDSAVTGGFYIFTYADFARSPEVFDIWVENQEDLITCFTETGWQIDWQ